MIWKYLRHKQTLVFGGEYKQIFAKDQSLGLVRR